VPIAIKSTDSSSGRSTSQIGSGGVDRLGQQATIPQIFPLVDLRATRGVRRLLLELEPDVVESQMKRCEVFQTIALSIRVIAAFRARLQVAVTISGAGSRGGDMEIFVSSIPRWGIEDM